MPHTITNIHLLSKEMKWFTPTGLEEDNIPYYPISGWIPQLLANSAAMDLLLAPTDTPG
jgi:hypothetical protein